MLLVCEHMAETEMAFTIWAAPVMAAAETALPSLFNLPKVQVPSLPALTMQGVYSIKSRPRSHPWLMPDLVFHLD